MSAKYASLSSHISSATNEAKSEDCALAEKLKALFAIQKPVPQFFPDTTISLLYAATGLSVTNLIHRKARKIVEIGVGEL